MGMPMELQTMIITKGNAERLDDELFKLVKKGYRLYPMDVPIEVKKTLTSEHRKEALVKKVEWENEVTTIYYQLTALHSSN